MKQLIGLVYSIFKSDKRQTTPYFSTCLIVTLILVINLFSIAIFFGVSSSVVTFSLIKKENLNRWANTIIQGTVIWLLFFYLFPKKELEEFVFSEAQIIKGKRRLILIVILSIVLLGAVLVRHGIRRGEI